MSLRAMALSKDDQFTGHLSPFRNDVVEFISTQLDDDLGDSVNNHKVILIQLSVKSDQFSEPRLNYPSLS